MAPRGEVAIHSSHFLKEACLLDTGPLRGLTATRILAALLGISIIFNVALWVHRESVLDGSYSAIENTMGILWTVSSVLKRNPSPHYQRESAYMVMEGVGELWAAEPVLAQEGYSQSEIYLLATGLLTFAGKLESTEPAALVRRQAAVLEELGPSLSPKWSSLQPAALGPLVLDHLAQINRLLKSANLSY